MCEDSLPTLRIIHAPENLTSEYVIHWKIKNHQLVNSTITVCQLQNKTGNSIDIKAPDFGWATVKLNEGSKVTSGEGGVSGDRIKNVSAVIPMVHTFPELHVSEKVAHEIALQDEQSLLNARKLVLLVDLDQTIIHTTNDLQAFKYKNVHRYRLPGSSLVYHTRFRPHLEKLLDNLSHYYQMHICTFGNRVYAHQLVSMIDPKRQYFSLRILSRDECFNPITKSANLRALFPRGLNLVCIIDDRGEVWDWSPNLVHVKPYRFFPDVGDINMYPWSSPSPPPPPPPPSSSTISKENEPQNTNVDDDNDDLHSDLNADNKTSFKAHESPCSNPESDSTRVESEDVDAEHDTSDMNVKPDSTDSVAGETKSDEANSDQNNSIQTSSLMEDQLDAADNNYLMRLQTILIQIHEAYFKLYDQWKSEQDLNKSNLSEDSASSPSITSSSSRSSTAKKSNQDTQPTESQSNLATIPCVAQIISQFRANVLRSCPYSSSSTENQLNTRCRISLSGLVPLHLSPDMSLAGQIALSLGASLQSSLKLPCLSDSGSFQPDDESDRHYTTHLVAGYRDTDKVNAAKRYLERGNTNSNQNKPPFYLVSPHWLWDCHYHWEHLPESNYPLEKDYDLCDFDNRIQPIPGSLRYARRLRRHHRTQHYLPTSFMNHEFRNYSRIERRIHKRTMEDDQKNQPNRQAKRARPIKLDSNLNTDSPLMSNIAFDSNSVTEVRDTDDEMKRSKDPEQTDTESSHDEDLTAQINSYLPPPKTLVLADNPLIHLPPDATDQMLAEIEDALLEEQHELVQSMPRETEIYDPAKLPSLDDSSSSDEERLNQSSTSSNERNIIRGNGILARRSKTSSDHSRRILTWQVRKELLLRRRHRASAQDVIKIDRKLKRLEKLFNKKQDSYSCDDLQLFQFHGSQSRLRAVGGGGGGGADKHKPIHHRATNRKVPRHHRSYEDTSSSSTDSESDLFDADYPKGWNPSKQPRRRSFKCRSCSLSPAIHSDPEFIGDWSASDLPNQTQADPVSYRPGTDWLKATELDEEDEEENEYDDGLLVSYGLGGGKDETINSKIPPSNTLRCTTDKKTNNTNRVDDDDDDDDDDNQSISTDPDSTATDGSTTDEDEDGDEEDYNDERWNPLREYL